MPTPLDPSDDKPVKAFASQKAWGQWLEKHHLQHAGLWMRLMKKDTGIRSVTYAEAVEEALCHGWIDGQKRGYDEASWLQKFTPRRKKSIWSKVNRDKIAALEKAGRLKPAGRAVVEAAKADGRWDAAYDSQSTATVPADFAARLDAHPNAKRFFATLKGSSRFAILFRLQTAKRPETRAKRMADFIAKLERGEAPHLLKPKS